MKTLRNSLTLPRSQSENMLYLPEQKISIVFGFDPMSHQTSLALFKNGIAGLRPTKVSLTSNP